MLNRSPRLSCTPLFCSLFPLAASHRGDRSGLFSIFTVAMLSTHLVLIGTNQTTVEHVAARMIKDREQDALDEMYSFWAFRSVSPPAISALAFLVVIGWPL